MPDSSESSNAESARLPIWLKLSCITLAIALLFLLVNRYVNKDRHGERDADDPKNSTITYPITVNTEWKDIEVRIDSVVRIDEKTIVAEWAYYNRSDNLSEAFSWGFSQPNFVALSKLIDADRREYAVMINDSREPICASTNRHDNSGWSKQVYGGRDLPVWAKFEVPQSVSEPLLLYLHGMNHNGLSELEIRLLTIDNQYERAYMPRATNWPDILIQLVGVTRRDDDTLEIKWKYINDNKRNRFFWGVNQPNYVAYTQIYDYTTGKLHNVAEQRQSGENKLLCSSTNKDNDSGWSRSIEPGESLEASAVFKGVKGQNIQVLFHSAMPLFYNPDKVLSQRIPKTN